MKKRRRETNEKIEETVERKKIQFRPKSVINTQISYDYKSYMIMVKCVQILVSLRFMKNLLSNALKYILLIHISVHHGVIKK